MSLYLDNASTTQIHPAAAAAMAALDVFGDPSRLYGEARRARIALDAARDQIARSIGGRAEEIVFTSGGTESCNLAISGGALAAAAARRPKRILVSAIEHTAVLEAARRLDDFEVVELPCGPTGLVDLSALRAECVAGAGLVSIQLANQEIGTVQPVAEAAAIAREAGALFHTDACMCVGNVPVDVRGLGVDLLSASGHKAYGPRGIGALWVRRGVRVRPMIVGDDRERGRRAGMENLPAVVGWAAALEARSSELDVEAQRLKLLAERLRAQLPVVVDDVAVHGDASECLSGLISFSVLYVEGETLLLGLDEKGIAVHSGSSCTSSTQEPSHVLAAIGALTQGSIRVSMGRDTTSDDVETFLRELPPVVARARALASGKA